MNAIDLSSVDCGQAAAWKIHDLSDGYLIGRPA